MLSVISSWEFASFCQQLPRAFASIHAQNNFRQISRAELISQAFVNSFRKPSLLGWRLSLLKGGGLSLLGCHAHNIFRKLSPAELIS